MNSDIEKYKVRIKSEILNKRLTNTTILKLISTIDDSINVNPKINKDDLIQILCTDTYLNDPHKFKIILAELGIEFPKKKYPRFIEIISEPGIYIDIVVFLLGLGYAIFSDHHIISKDEANKTEIIVNADSNKTEIIDEFKKLNQKVDKISSVLENNPNEQKELNIQPNYREYIERSIREPSNNDFGTDPIEFEATHGLYNKLKIKSAHFVNMGNALFKKGKYERAIKCYNFAISFNDSNYIAHANKGITLFDLGYKEEALVSFNKVIEIKKGMPELYLIRGIAYEAIDSINLANLDYERVKKYIINSNLSFPTKGLKTQKQLDKVEIVSEIEIEKKHQKVKPIPLAFKAELSDTMFLYKHYSLIYLRSAILFHSQKEYKKAIMDYNMAIKFDLQNPDIYIRRSRCFAQLGKIKEATADSVLANSLHSSNEKK